MGFSLFYLLFALPLLGVPVLVHLLTRKRSVQLPFPALRFLRSRHQVRQRHRRVRHWLLLTLRVLVLLVICCALIPPLRCDNDGARGSNGPASGAAVLVFDTSPSMEYNPGDRTRLDLALFHARAVIDSLPPDCRVALIDSADPASVQDNTDRFTSPIQARALLDGIRIRPANAPLNGMIQRAWRLLRQGTAGECGGAVYVFSDRTTASWDSAQTMPARPDNVRIVYVDVGAQEPLDLAIEQVEVSPSLTAPGERAEVRVRVRATGGDLESDLFCQFKDEPGRAQDRQAVHLKRGEEATFVFPFKVPETPPESASLLPRQVTVRLATADNLAFNNIRYATYLVRRPRRVLALAEAPPPGKSSSAELLKAVLESVALDQPTEAFRCDVRSVADPVMKVDDLLREYAVVCLFEVVHPSPALWDILKAYVQKGGGLLLVPGGDEVVPALPDENRGAEVGLAPARLIGLTTSPAPGVGWDNFNKHVHPLTASIRTWLADANPDFNRPGHRPAVGRSWTVGSMEGAEVVADFTDGRPALLERSVGLGKVIMLTSPLSPRRLDANRSWQNYWGLSSFGLVLVDQVCRYLDGSRGADAPGPVNGLCESGRVMMLLAPAGAVPPLTLSGPGLSQSQQAVANADPKGRLMLPQAIIPGNYTIQDANGRIVAGFSLNVPPQESRLERVPVAELEAALGRDAVVPGDKADSLTPDQGPGGLDLVPLLLVILVLAVASEAMFANRASKPPASPDARTAVQTGIINASAGALAGLILGVLVGALIGSGWALVFSSGISLFDSVTRFALIGGLLGMVVGAGLRVLQGWRWLEMRLSRSSFSRDPMASALPQRAPEARG